MNRRGAKHASTMFYRACEDFLHMNLEPPTFQASVIDHGDGNDGDPWDDDGSGDGKCDGDNTDGDASAKRAMCVR